jgi:hypothetical protein
MKLAIAFTPLAAVLLCCSTKNDVTTPHVDASRLGCACNLILAGTGDGVPDAGPPPGGCAHCPDGEVCLSFIGVGYPVGRPPFDADAESVPTDAAPPPPTPLSAFCASEGQLGTIVTCPPGQRVIPVDDDVRCSGPVTQ